MSRIAVYVLFYSLICCVFSCSVFAVDDVLDRNLLMPGDRASCGIQCLCVLSKYHGVDVDLNQLAKEMLHNNKDVSMLELKNQAEKLGFICHGYKEETTQKLSELPLPAIVHFTRGHYQLLLSIEGDNVRVVDVPLKIRNIPLEQFKEEWSGYVLTCEMPKEAKMLPQPSEKGEFVYIRNPNWDIGSRVSGEICKHTFKIINASNKQITIKSTKSSCGCILAKSPPKVIAPQSASNIDVVLKTKGKYGPQRGHVIVTTDHPEYNRMEMYYEGVFFQLEDELMAVPKLLFWGDVIKGKVEKRRVVLSKIGGGNIKFIKAECDIPSIKVIPLQQQKTAEKYDFDIILDSNGMSLGGFNGNLKLIAEHDVSAEINVPIEGSIISEVKPFPASVYIQSNENVKISKSIQLTNLLNNPFEVSQVNVAPSTLPIKFTYEKESGSKWLINIDFEGKKNDGIEQGNIRVTIKDDKSEIIIPVTIL